MPGFNTLSNHGYLNRNGRNITDIEVRAAFKNFYSIDESATNILLGGIAKSIGANGNIDLIMFREHNVIYM
jgi:Peroxidase, family 2